LGRGLGHEFIVKMASEIVTQNGGSVKNHKKASAHTYKEAAWEYRKTITHSINVAPMAKSVSVFLPHFSLIFLRQTNATDIVWPPGLRSVPKFNR